MKDSPLNWNLIAEEIKDEIVDFSVNINPLGIPDLVKDYLMHINGIGNRYPDSECKQLRDLLAQKYKIHPENVVQKLLDKGIKVRDCSKFYGLDSSYCRVAIWNHSENLVLLQAFKELFVK